MTFESILGRPASSQELRKAREFLREQAAMLKDPEKLTLVSSKPEEKVPPASDPYVRAQENLVHVLFNHNGFVTVR